MSESGVSSEPTRWWLKPLPKILLITAVLAATLAEISLNHITGADVWLHFSVGFVVIMFIAWAH